MRPSLALLPAMHWLLQVGFKATGRSCSQPGCRGRLKDVVLDWEDALPEDKLEETERIAGEADLAICLGTSLQITPACDLPDATAKAGGHRVTRMGCEVLTVLGLPACHLSDLAVEADRQMGDSSLRCGTCRAAHVQAAGEDCQGRRASGAWGLAAARPQLADEIIKAGELMVLAAWGPAAVDLTKAGDAQLLLKSCVQQVLTGWDSAAVRVPICSWLMPPITAGAQQVLACLVGGGAACCPANGIVQAAADPLSAILPVNLEA